MTKKKIYAEAELEIVLFDKLDIITTSGNNPGNNPQDGWGSGGDLDQDAWD